MTAAPPRESYPPSTPKVLFRQLDAAIDDAEIAIARHFRAFASAIRDKLPVLIGPFTQLTLDEYADAVDTVLGPDLDQLRRELTITVGVSTRRAMQSGASHGQGLLNSITVDWDINQPEVDAFLKRHVLDLAKDLDGTTRGRLATVIRRGVREGQGIAQIQREIMDVARRMSVERARLIAQTETIRALNAGAVSLYRKSGVVNGLRWVDGQFGACLWCQSLHGKIIRLGGEFEAVIGGTALGGPFPPAHPGCRCAVAPVLEEVNVG